MDPILLNSIIKKDIQCKSNKYEARNFYYNNEITPMDIDYYVNGQIKTKKAKCNKIQINYLKQLVTQKIDYILSKPTSTKNSIFNWDEILTQMTLNASLDVISWLHIYVNKGKLDWIIINDIEIIPFYNNTKYIQELIRYYPIDKNIYSIEYWNADEILYFTLKDDLITQVDKKPHYKSITLYQGEVEEVLDQTFKTLPFIPLFNNRNKESDAQDIKNLLNMYNSICSGFIDNINEFQEAIMILKNFSGQQSDLDDVMDTIKENKIVGVPADGDLSKLEISIPVEARTVILSLIRDAIYSLGRGVDIDKLVSANNITNVFIKSRYQALDFKANDTIGQIKIFYANAINFINEFYNQKLNSEITFNKTLINNESEQIETCVQAIALRDAGLISNQTLMQNIPWVIDSSKELKQIDKEKPITQLDQTSSNGM